MASGVYMDDWTLLMALDRLAAYNFVMEAGMEVDRNTVTVNLGDQMRRVEELVRSGSYGSVDEVVRAGLLALERGEDDRIAWLSQLAEESLSEPGVDVAADEVFEDIYAMHRSRNASSAR